MSSRTSASSSPTADGKPVTAVVLVLLVAMTGIGGNGVVAGGEAGGTTASSSPTAALAAAENATLQGTVTNENGTPVESAIVLVVAGKSPLVEKMTTTELVELANNEASDDLFIARTDADGQYSLSLPAGTYRVIALQDDDASAVETRELAAGGTRDLDLTLHEYRPLTVRATGGAASPGNETGVTIELYNNGASPVEDLSFALDGVPEGWTVVDHEDAGATFEQGALQWTWSSVPVGEFADPSVTFRLPADAEIGNYSVTVVPESAHRTYDPETVSVRIHEPPTPSETPTHVGGGGGEITTEPEPTTGPGGTATADEGTTPTTEPVQTTTVPGETTDGSDGGGVPGLGVTVAVIALVLAVGGMVARRRD